MTAHDALPLSSFPEREFYLREFRGRTLVFALPDAQGSLRPLGAVLDALVEGGARAVVIAPPHCALGGFGLDPTLAATAPRFEGNVWRRLRGAGRAGVSVAGAFAGGCREVAERLGVFKLVWIDARGGLRDRAGQRVSFCDLGELRRRLEGAPGERDDLWREVEGMLQGGSVTAVNICTLDGLDDELFTYAGSGTLFTRQRYVAVRPLCIDDFDAAQHLVARGVAEGYLAERSPEELDDVLASGFGAFIEDRHLAGVGALLVRGEDPAGEIAALCTLTRFLGEGIGAPLVSFALEEARRIGLRFVFACTTSERVGGFFERQSFRKVSDREIPPSKWEGYDPERRRRLLCYAREL